MIKEYCIYQPSATGSISDEWHQCLKQIRITQENGKRPIKLYVFTSLTDRKSYMKAREEITGSVIDTFKEQTPAVSFTVHPPEKPYNIAVEALFTSSDTPDIFTRYYGSVPYVVINNQWGKEVWGAGLGSGLFSENTRKAAEGAFDQVVALLEKEDMTLNNIIRQWNYIGNILKIRNGIQNYQVFNEVRSEYYSRYRTVIGYPAATGIGMKSESVIIDFCAVSPDESVRINRLSNPNQVNAYEYTQNILRGVKDTGKLKKHPPQFERALIMAFKNNAMLHISGTASIIGQETIGKDDVAMQTTVTIENIKKLTSPEMISQVLPEGIQYSLKYGLLRVYIRNQEDFNIVRTICKEHFPGVPAVFIEADICRDDLLTEIEAEVQIQY
jgi:enamine deaminase RidA (YjgF/YER057c/UK114 family)